MLTPERHQLILMLLKEKEVIKLQELVEETNTSESTIRRDLIQLEQLKKLKRIHGGAALLQGKRQEPSIIEKSAKNLHEKKIIAKEAASLVKKGDSIYIDAGTTTLQMHHYLDLNKNITIVTNSIGLIEPLLSKGIQTYLIGGSLKGATGALIGSLALKSIETLRFDKCFIGANGIHMEHGFTTPDPEEALIKKIAIQLSNEKYILADQSKLGEVSFSKIANIDEANLIINQTDEDRLQEYEFYTSLKVVTS